MRNPVRRLWGWPWGGRGRSRSLLLVLPGAALYSERLPSPVSVWACIYPWALQWPSMLFIRGLMFLIRNSINYRAFTMRLKGRIGCRNTLRSTTNGSYFYFKQVSLQGENSFATMWTPIGKLPRKNESFLGPESFLHFYHDTCINYELFTHQPFFMASKSSGGRDKVLWIFAAWFLVDSKDSENVNCIHEWMIS